jgi:predicted ester cyclase
MAMTDGPSVDGKALVRAYLEDVFTNGKVAGMDRYLSGDTFKASVADLVATWRRAFSDFRIVVDDALADGDKVVTVEILSGTHDGVFDSTIGPIEPTGRTISWSRIAIRTLEDGRFVKGFFEEDEVGMLRQMGALELINDRAAAHRSTAQAGTTKSFRVLDAISPADSEGGPDDGPEA